jgi:WD40 repeat protein
MSLPCPRLRAPLIALRAKSWLATKVRCGLCAASMEASVLLQEPTSLSSSGISMAPKYCPLWDLPFQMLISRQGGTLGPSRTLHNVHAELKPCSSLRRIETLFFLTTQGASALVTMKGHSAGVTAVCESRSSSQLISASEDRSIRIWDARRGVCLSVSSLRSFIRGPSLEPIHAMAPMTASRHASVISLGLPWPKPLHWTHS